MTIARPISLKNNPQRGKNYTCPGLHLVLYCVVLGSNQTRGRSRPLSLVVYVLWSIPMVAVPTTREVVTVFTKIPVIVLSVTVGFVTRGYGRK